MKMMILLILLSCSLFSYDFEREITPFSGQVNTFTGEYIEGGVDLVLESPEPLTFSRIFSHETHSWKFNHPSLITPGEAVPDGPSYEFDSDSLLTAIKTPFHQAKITRSSEGILTIKADDGREMRYHLSSLDPSRDKENVLIDEVIYPNGRFLKYKYRKHPLIRKYLISRIETPSGSYIETEYYDNKYNNVGGKLVVINNPFNDFRTGRVKLQKAPTGKDGAPEIFQTFFYEPLKTTVVDALGNKKIYSFEDDGRIRLIEWWEHKGHGEKCIKKIHVSWNENSYKVIDGDENTVFEKPFSSAAAASPNSQFEAERPEDGTILYEYNLDGKISEIKSENPFFRKQFFYDKANRLVLVRYEEDGKVVDESFVYNTLGQKIASIDTFGNETHYEYDGFGNIKAISYPVVKGLRPREEFKYDLFGNKIWMKDTSFQETTWEYHADGKIKCIKHPNGNIETFTYSPLGYLVSHVDRQGVRRDFEYSSSGEIVKKRSCSPFENAIEHHYDENGRLEAIVKPDGVTIHISHSEQGISRVASSDHSVDHSLSYDREGRIICLTDYINNTQTTREYDSEGQLVRETLGNDLSLAFTYENGKRTSLTLPDNSSITYEQDAIQRSGNILEKQEPVQSNYEADVPPSEAKFDINGNLIQKRDMTFAYDALDRLVKVYKANELLAEYIYDPFHRRIMKKIDGKNIKYIWDGSLEIGSDKGELRILSPGNHAEIGATLSLELQGEQFTPLQDTTGSIVGLIKDGEVIERYSMTPFGKESFSQKTSPWRYMGKRVDEETGFVLFGRRYLDPELKRWITLDPLGYHDGPDRFVFAKNDPLKYKDPHGLFIGSTLSFLWNAKEAFKRALQGIFGIENEIGDEVTTILEAMVGKTMLGLSGYYHELPEEGVHGQGEHAERIRITVINGVSNIRAHFCEAMEVLLETHGGNNIHYIFRPTRGWCGDMARGLLTKMGYVSSYAEKLANTWQRLIQEMGGVKNGGLIIHYCHSLGGTDTTAALKFLTVEERKMIRIFSFGSATLIPENCGAESATNFISMRDGITLFDPIGILRGAFDEDSNVVLVGTIFGVPLIDHMFVSCTYVEVLRMLGLMYMKSCAK